MNEHKDRPNMQFSLSTLLVLIAVCALVFTCAKLVGTADALPDEAFGVLGWLLFAALALVTAVTHWIAAKNYRIYVDEIQKTAKEAKAINEQCAARSLDVQMQTNQLLEDILKELRK